MGLAVVLVFWILIGMILAGIGLVVFGGATAYFTRDVTTGRGKVIVAAGVFPFACLVWVGSIFIVQAIVNEVLLDRDLGIGDSWHCPLPNGYRLEMIDVIDEGSIYNPKTQRDGIINGQGDSVSGVRMLQVVGPYILGGFDSGWFEHFFDENKKVDSYFVLDIRTGKKTILPNYDTLRSAALQLHIQPNLEPIHVVYSRYRFTWFDVVVGLLSFAPPLIGFALLIWWIVRFRKTRTIIPQPA